jgi:hypothetical protein
MTFAFHPSLVRVQIKFDLEPSIWRMIMESPWKTDALARFGNNGENLFTNFPFHSQLKPRDFHSAFRDFFRRLLRHRTGFEGESHENHDI